MNSSTNALDMVLEKAVDYDRWRTPLDPRLQQAVTISSVSLVASLITLICLPGMASLLQSGFFLIGSQALAGFLDFVYALRPILFGINVISLIGLGFLLYYTDMLEEGRAIWHEVAIAEVVIATVGALVLGFAVLVIAINLVLWIIGIVLAVSVLMGVLASM